MPVRRTTTERERSTERGIRSLGSVISPSVRPAWEGWMRLPCMAIMTGRGRPSLVPVQGLVARPRTPLLARCSGAASAGASGIGNELHIVSAWRAEVGAAGRALSR